MSVNPVVGSDIFRALSEDEIIDIMSCLDQFAHNGNFDKTGNTFFCIQVWFANDANKYRQSNTPLGGFHIRVKTEEMFGSPNLLNHSKLLWHNNLVPVEIIREDRAIFYALYKCELMEGRLNTCMMVAETL